MKVVQEDSVLCQVPYDLQLVMKVVQEDSVLFQVLYGLHLTLR